MSKKHMSIAEIEEEMSKPERIYYALEVKYPTKRNPDGDIGITYNVVRGWVLPDDTDNGRGFIEWFYTWEEARDRGRVVGQELGIKGIA